MESGHHPRKYGQPDVVNIFIQFDPFGKLLDHEEDERHNQSKEEHLTGGTDPNLRVGETRVVYSSQDQGAVRTHPRTLP